MNHNYQLENHWNLKLSAFENGILRVRITPPECTGKVSGLNKYGFISEPERAADEEILETQESITLQSGGVSLSVNRKTGTFRLNGPDGALLLEQTSLDFSDGFCKASFAAEKDEDWVGFGDVSRTEVFRRGHTARCWLSNVKTYIAVPFFMSTRGYGVLLNSTYRSDFDMCAADPDHFSFVDRGGIFDLYLFTAPDFKRLLGLYTLLSGRPQLPPIWSFGLWHICNNIENSRDAVESGYRYRELGIPCDVIGLEPGWMSRNYDFSTEKQWNPDRFPNMLKSFQHRNRTFIDALKQGMGFHFELWLCCDYDLTYEEVRCLEEESSENVSEEIVMDEEEFDTRLVVPTRFDSITKPEEPWFEHLKNFVEFGADFFKMDASNQICPHPDRLYGNGMTDAECHNLYPLFLTRQMWEGFANHAKRRPFVFTPCGWTGFQKWAATWTGDTGGGMTTLAGMLNTAMVGHGLTTNDMAANEKEGVHFGYLLPLSQINNYSCYKMPWYWGPKFIELHRYYSSLRSRLIPYLYSSMRKTTRTGIPILIPLPLEFQDDIRCRSVLNEYLLGRDLLVSIYTPEIYFPSGRWKNFWTGKTYTGNSENEIPWPDDRGGGLYVREGAIIPFGPVMQYRGERPVDELELYLFPGPEKTEFEYYEDDGVSFDYLKDKYSITLIQMETKDRCVHVKIMPDGKGSVRKLKIRMALDAAPSHLKCEGTEVQFSWDDARSELTAELPKAGEVIVS
jgi:alpha-glucosidase (family GH31 glycosyl hydrolase)